MAYVRACGGDTGEWEKRWHALAAELAAGHNSEPGPDTETDQDCPYIGLTAFQPEDAARFFGRDKLTGDLVTQARAQRFVAVFGASGSGKSSLLRAGLLPKVRGGRQAGAAGWRTVLFTPGPHPLEECAARLAVLTGGTATALRDDLESEPRALHLTALQALADQPEGSELLVIVDQFEEIFTLCASARERARFVNVLITACQAANSRTRVVIGVRADFYAHCAEYPELVEALREGQFLVGAMTTDELRQVINQPAVQAGCTVEGALLARIIADATGQANALPLVSHALRETWHRRRGNTLTLAGYEAAGGIQHALAHSAEAVHAKLSPHQRRLLRWIFLRLVALGEGTDDTKRRVPRADLDTTHPDTGTVLDTLAQARLVTLDTDTVEITHEALIQAWPRLRGWLNEDRAGLLIHQQLASATAAWEREHHDSGLLYRGGRLAAAREWAERHRGDAQLSSGVSAFLAASTRQERRAVTLRRAAVAVLAMLTVLASATAVIAFKQRATAQAERNSAVSQQILAEADQARGSDPSLAAQLDLAAYRLERTTRASVSLLDSRNFPLSRPLTGHSRPVYGVAFSPDGRTLATGAGDNTIRLWDMRDPSHPRSWGKPLTGHKDWVYWLQFSPDGRTLASASRDHTARLWDIRDPAHPKVWNKPLAGHAAFVFSVAFSPNGRTLATASYDKTVRLWDVADPAHPTALGQPLTGHTDSVASAAFSPDGRTVASAGHDHTIRLWNVTDPVHPTMWRPPLTSPDVVYAVAFSPDSRIMASVGADKTVQLWNVADPAHTIPLGPALTGHTNTLLAVAFSRDGHTLATGGADNTIRLWNLTDPAHPTALGQPLAGHTGLVDWIAFSPDGRTLASASEDATVRVWNLPHTTLTGHAGSVTTVAYSPDGRTLASAGADRTIRLWNARDTAGPTPLGPPITVPNGAVNTVAFSPDSRTIAAVGDDHTLRLWNAADPAHPKQLTAVPTGSTGSAHALAFSPTASLLATDGADHALRLWDIRDPAHPGPVGQPLTAPTIKVVQWASFSPDGNTLASTSDDDKIRLWNVRHPARPQPASVITTGETGGVLWGAYHPTEHILATAAADHTIRLWDIHDPDRPRVLGQPLSGHTGEAVWAGFSPDGRTLASSSQDGTIRLWNTTDPAHATPQGGPLTANHTGIIHTAAFAPDGSTLASAGDDRTIELTGLDPEPAIQRACATTTPLTQQQWQQNVPELPFRPPCTEKH
ncbi:nSTAND1 domain-containing NTPase [Streptomyces orinoci]|uniref:Novel STAND NTPase 1 domain-containing protein n=1 Tax=Streptomyces orinoci TaxID=67339 RepID=A0ABV3JUU3_STRON|nr:hypothetical protein [Streptomyces orinoci]